MPSVIPSERTPARRRAAALAVLGVLAGGCAAPAPTTTPVDPIVLREDDGVTPGGAAGADPVPLPDPEPAGAGGTATTAEPPPSRAPVDDRSEATRDAEPDEGEPSEDERSEEEPSEEEPSEDEPSEDEDGGDDD